MKNQKNNVSQYLILLFSVGNWENPEMFLQCQWLGAGGSSANHKIVLVRRDPQSHRVHP